MTVAVGFIILSMGSVLDVQSISDDEFEDFTTSNPKISAIPRETKN